MVPAMMEELLFDDILYGSRAREEHRRFQQVLSFVADEVLDIQQLLEEVLAVPEQRTAILGDLGRALSLGAGHGLPAAGPDAGGPRRDARHRDREARRRRSPTRRRSCTTCRPSPTTSSSAIRWSSSATARSAARWRRRRGCASRSSPGTSSSSTRDSRRDGGRSGFSEFSTDYRRPSSYARMRPTLEGGDILVLREDMLAIGYSERTEKTTIERLAESFKSRRSRRSSGSSSSRSLPRARSCTSTRSSPSISRDECLVYGPMILPDGAGGGGRLRVRPDQARDHLDDGEGPALGAAHAEDGPEADPLRRERPDRRAARAVDRRRERVRDGAGRRPHLRPQRAHGGGARRAPATRSSTRRTCCSAARSSRCARRRSTSSVSPRTSSPAPAAARAAWRCRSSREDLPA